MRLAVSLLQLSAVAGLLLPSATPTNAMKRVRSGVIVASEGGAPGPKKTPEEALQEAALKLEKLQETNEAPKSFADLGLKPEVPDQPEVPGFITAAPPVLIAFSAALVVLNNLGTFGDGPDLDAFVEWANSQ